MSTPIISCVIPTCDREELLKEALLSVKRQSVPPSEIVVVNNGSKPLDADGLPVDAKVFEIVPRSGAAQTRNFGASVARGDYLAFLDDDDLWSPDYLRNASAAAREGARCIVSRLDQTRDGVVSPYRNPHGIMTLDNLMVFNPGITGSNLVISKKLFFELHGYDPRLPPSEDKSLLVEALLHDTAITTLPDNFALARMHAVGARLTDATSQARGIRQFTRKYGHLMNLAQWCFNIQKMCFYSYSGGRKSAYLPFRVLQIIVPLIRLLFRQNQPLTYRHAREAS